MEESKVGSNSVGCQHESGKCCEGKEREVVLNYRQKYRIEICILPLKCKFQILNLLNSVSKRLNVKQKETEHTHLCEEGHVLARSRRNFQRLPIKVRG